MPDIIEISIILPVYNEEANIRLLYDRISSAMSMDEAKYEVIFIDDGSSDASFNVLEQLGAKDCRVKAVSFSRNFGHMAALSAGLDYARGQAVITMDADLQHPPEVIPELIRRWKNGSLVVGTIRKDSVCVGRLKRYTSRAFYWLMNRIASVKIPPNAADFRLLDRKVVDVLKKMNERGWFLRGLVGWVGFHPEYVEYQAGPRQAGKSAYPMSKMLSFALDGITSFSSFPLRLATYCGFVVTFFAFLYILYAICVRLFTSRAMPGWASVLIAVLFLGGVQLVFLGIIGEYLSRVFEGTKARPLYIVENEMGFSPK